MNYKLEKFWNTYSSSVAVSMNVMNYKLEKFWNDQAIKVLSHNSVDEL